MKTLEEIKKTIRRCLTEESCLECPYITSRYCVRNLMEDACSYMEQLEERIDTLMMQIRGDCGTCKHRNERDTCRACCDAEYGYHPLWEYEGLPEVTSHKKPV